MKLSDALRGAADRAPVEQMRVSAADATGRIRRERALRVGANGLLGAGAAAVIAVGAFGPFTFGASNESADMAPAMDDGANMFAEEGASEDSAAGGAADTRLAEQWMCGQDFDPNDGAWSWGDASGVTYTVAEPEVDGAEVQLPNTLEAHRPVDLISSADAIVTWEGIIVGRQVQPSPIQYGPADEPMLPDGAIYERLVPASDFETLEQWTILNPVNCWDGAPLPAGDYDVHQAWTLAYAEGAIEPGTTSDGGGAAEGGGAGEDAATSGIAPDEQPDEAVPAPDMPELFRVAADPVTLTIDGEPVDDPFGRYLDGDAPVAPLPLPEPIAPEPLPDGYLTPDIARQMFESNADDGKWDMAEGTQRWVVVNDSQSPSDDWSQHYYGCSWDGVQGATFPARSAELTLLDIAVDVPSRIGVSYGFVVDDNPLVRSEVTNISEFTIPGIHSAQPQLFLVQQGRVVAEAYPVSTDPHGMGIARGAIEGDSAAMMIDPGYGGALAPAQSVDGEFLWRDVNGCHLESGPRAVEPGTYTVLALQSVSLSGAQQAGWGEVEPLPGFDESALIGPTPDQAPLDRGAAPPHSELTIGEAIEPDMAIAPAPDQMDWLELQGWTSLGTVTVSAS